MERQSREIAILMGGQMKTVKFKQVRFGEILDTSSLVEAEYDSASN